MRCITFPTYFQYKILNKKMHSNQFYQKKKRWLDIFLCNSLQPFECRYLVTISLSLVFADACNKVMVRDGRLAVYHLVESLREFESNDAAGKTRAREKPQHKIQYCCGAVPVVVEQCVDHAHARQTHYLIGGKLKVKKLHGPRCQGNSKCKWDEEDSAHQLLSILYLLLVFDHFKPYRKWSRSN